MLQKSLFWFWQSCFQLYNEYFKILKRISLHLFYSNYREARYVEIFNDRIISMKLLKCHTLERKTLIWMSNALLLSVTCHSIWRCFVSFCTNSEEILCFFFFFGYYVPTLKRKDRINTMLNALKIPCLENSRPIKCLSDILILSDWCSGMLVIAWGPAWLSLPATLILIIQFKLMSV